MPLDSTFARARRTTGRGLERVVFHLVVWSLVIVVLLPLLWPLMMSLHDTSVQTLVDRGLLWWLRGVELTPLLGTLFFSRFPRLIANSALVSTATAVLSTILAAGAAYGLTRFDFAGRRSALLFLLVVPMVPPAVIVIPLFLYFRSLSLLNSHVGLVVAYLAVTLPFAVWLLIPLFATVPRTVEDAARIDGCTHLGAFVRVFLPLVKPALAAAFTLSWVLAYNEFLFAVVLIDDRSLETLPVGLMHGGGDPGIIAVLATLPLLAIFYVLWRVFLSDEIGRFAA